jgi:hypothetical protein
MAVSKRPVLQAPELPVPPSTVVPPRTAADDGRFASAEQFETPEALLRGVQNGSVRTLNPETMPRSGAPEPEPARRRAPELSLSTKVPDYVMTQLRRRYADTGITIRNQILLALRKDGFEIEDDDLQDERKRPRR